MLLDAEPAAGRAGAVGIVEGEQPRLDFRNGEAGDRTGEFFREQNPLRSALVVNFCHLLRRSLGLLPPPLRGQRRAKLALGIGEGGSFRCRRVRLTPHPTGLWRSRDFISAYFFKTAAGGRLL